MVDETIAIIRCIQRENGSRHLVWTTFLLVPGHGVLARAPSLDGAYDKDHMIAKITCIRKCGCQSLIFRCIGDPPVTLSGPEYR